MDEGFRVDYQGKTYLVKISQTQKNTIIIEAREYYSNDSYMGEFPYQSLNNYFRNFVVFSDITEIKNALCQTVYRRDIAISKNEREDILNLRFNVQVGVDNTPFICELLRPIISSTPQTRPLPQSQYLPIPEDEPLTQPKFEPKKTVLRNNYNNPTPKQNFTKPLIPEDEDPNQARESKLRAKKPPRPKRASQGNPEEELKGNKFTSYIKKKDYEQEDENFCYDKIVGLSKRIIQDKEEIYPIQRKIENKLKNNVKYHLLYKATIDGDDPTIFHSKCDYHENTLVLVSTDSGARFGGFTTQTWEGEYITKKDDDAFVFSLSSKKIYGINPGEFAIGCYPEFGPVFMGCQIRIYGNFFTKGGSTCQKGMNYSTTEDFELSKGEQKFNITEVEVYDCITD